jgi:hypothetical protein
LACFSTNPKNHVRQNDEKNDDLSYETPPKRVVQGAGGLNIPKGFSSHLRL